MAEGKRKRSSPPKADTSIRAHLIGVDPKEYLRQKRKQRLVRLVASPAFNVIVALFIIVSVGLIFAEFFVPPSRNRELIIVVSDAITWLFIIELILRYHVAPNKRIFFSDYWIDILSVLPVLRVFRTFRVLRLLRLLRITRAFIILARHGGWISVKMEKHVGSFAFLVITSLLLILCGTLATLYFEQSGEHPHVPAPAFIQKAWQIAFLFTSGEVIGDLPVGFLSRLLAIGITVAGLIVFAVFVGTVSASMSTFFKAKMDTKDIDLSDLKDHLIICGWDRMGSIILSELELVPQIWRHGVVIVAETDEDLIAVSTVKNKDRLFHINDDFTKIEVLERVNAGSAKTAIVLADKGAGLRDQDRDARTVLAALTLEKLNPDIFTCAELLDDRNSTHLKIAGVEEIISRTDLTAGLFASTAINSGVASLVSDILTHREGNYIRKVNVPDEFVGRTFFDAYGHFKEHYDATVVAIDSITAETGVYEQHVNPPAKQELEDTDQLVLVLNRNSIISELG